MIKRLFFSVLLAIICISRMYADTDYSIYNDVVYINPAQGSPGSDVVLSVQLKNELPDTVAGFQFQLVLPIGISITDAYVSEERTTLSFHSMDSDPATSVILCHTSLAGGRIHAFAGTSGEVGQILIHIDENVAFGDYPITITNEVISFMERGEAGSTKNDFEDIVFTLTIGEKQKPIYGTEYLFSMVPAILETGAENTTMTLSFVTNDDAIAAKQVDATLEFSTVDVTNYGLIETSNLLSGRGTSASIIENDGKINFSFQKTSGLANAALMDITIWRDDEAGTFSLADGIYAITLKDIVVTATDNSVYHLAPQTSYFKVGSPIGASLKLEGLLADEVAEALNRETAISFLDLSDVVAINGTLAILDSRSISLPRWDVENVNVTYNRTIINEWGTICLPIEVSSNENVQYYELTSIQGNKMIFSPIARVEAGVPAVYKCKGSNSLSIAVQQATFYGQQKVWSGGVEGNNWTMNGTFVAINIDPVTKANKDIYYNADNLFYYASQAFLAEPYRAWFETDKMTEAPSYYSISSTVTDMYLISFVNYDGSELQADSLSCGSMPQYNGEIPTKPATAQYTYTFKGWDKEIVSVVGAETYTAQYDSVVNQYTITVSGENCTTTGEGTYDYGTEVTLTVTPDEGYRFIEWSDGVPEAIRQIIVVEDATYIAHTEKQSVSTGQQENSLSEQVQKIFDGTNYYILRGGKRYTMQGQEVK